MRKLIEDDDRYRVAWCDPDLSKSNGTAIVLFMPQDLKERQEKGADSSALSHPIRFLFRILPSIPQLTAYMALSFLGMLLHPLSHVVQYSEILRAFMDSFPVELGPCWYNVIDILTILGFSVSWTYVALTFMSKFYDLIYELKKGSND
jgi:hypothetical protein